MGDNVHLLHYRNDIGVSEAVVDGTQRQKVDVSTILEKHIMICPKIHVPNDRFCKRYQFTHGQRT